MGRSAGGGGGGGFGGGFGGGGFGFGGFEPRPPRPPRPPRRYRDDSMFDDFIGSAVGSYVGTSMANNRNGSRRHGSRYSSFDDPDYIDLGNGQHLIKTPPQLKVWQNAVIGSVVLIFIAFFLMMFAGMSSGASLPYTSSTTRTKLAASASQKTAWYADEDGDWIHDQSKMEKGLTHFYDVTGVRPFVLILKNGSETSTTALQKEAEEKYSQMFQDEGHFLLVFCDDGNGAYNCGYQTGSSARQVMDDEAVGILQKYLERWYNNMSISEEEIFSNAFSNTGDAIMQTGAAKSGGLENNPVNKLGVVLLIVGFIATPATYIVYAVKKRTFAQAAQNMQNGTTVAVAGAGAGSAQVPMSGAATGSGTNVPGTGNVPTVPPSVARIDVTRLASLDPTMQDAANAINRVLDAYATASATDTPTGIVAFGRKVNNLATGLSELIQRPEFAGRSDNDKSLVFSLATSWLGDAWDDTVKNCDFTRYGGKAGAKAYENLRELDRQCDAVEDTIDKIRTGLVDDSASDVMGGTEYLRQRLGDDAVPDGASAE